MYNISMQLGFAIYFKRQYLGKNPSSFLKRNEEKVQVPKRCCCILTARDISSSSLLCSCLSAISRNCTDVGKYVIIQQDLTYVSKVLPQRMFCLCHNCFLLQYTIPTYQLGNFLVLVKKGLIRQLYGNFYGLVFTLKNKTSVNHLLVQVNLFPFILKIYLCILLYSGCIIVKHISHTIFNQSSLRAIIHMHLQILILKWYKCQRSVEP